MTSEELLKMVLEELRNTNVKIDSIKDSVTDKLNHIQNDLTGLSAKTTELDKHVAESKADIGHLEHTIKGNGSPGLKEKVSTFDEKFITIEKEKIEFKKFVENKFETIVKEQKEENKELVNKVETYVVAEKQENVAVKVAIIGGSISGFVALVAAIFEMIPKL